MNGDDFQMPDPSAAVALAMIGDETRGLALAESLGIAPARAQALRDDLGRRVSASMQDTIDAQARLIAEQTEELATFARIAEAYRTGQHRSASDAARLERRMAGVRQTVHDAKPRARAWAVAHLPPPVIRALKFVRARVVRP